MEVGSGENGRMVDLASIENVDQSPNAPVPERMQPFIWNGSNNSAIRAMREEWSRVGDALRDAQSERANALRSGGPLDYSANATVTSNETVVPLNSVHPPNSTNSTAAQNGLQRAFNHASGLQGESWTDASEGSSEASSDSTSNTSSLFGTNPSATIFAFDETERLGSDFTNRMRGLLITYQDRVSTRLHDGKAETRAYSHEHFTHNDYPYFINGTTSVRRTITVLYEKMSEAMQTFSDRVSANLDETRKNVVLTQIRNIKSIFAAMSKEVLELQVTLGKGVRFNQEFQQEEMNFMTTIECLDDMLEVINSSLTSVRSELTILENRLIRQVPPRPQTSFAGFLQRFRAATANNNERQLTYVTSLQPSPSARTLPDSNISAPVPSRSA